jgi:hypothetical protein
MDVSLPREKELLSILESWGLIRSDFQGSVTLEIHCGGLRDISKNEKAIKKFLLTRQTVLLKSVQQ